MSDLPIAVSPEDVSYERAARAYAGVSMVPEQRARQAQQEYVCDMRTAYEALRPLADTPEKEQLLAEELERFKQGYLQRYGAYLDAKSRCLSWAVTGRSNFPVRRNEKRMETERRRLEELVSWKERALTAIRRKLRPETAAISSDDADAVEKRQAKIEKLEELRDRMKLVNSAYRKAKGDIDAMVGVSDETKARIRICREDTGANTEGWQPFEAWELSNLGAQIRRLKQRVAELERRRADTTVEIEVGDVQIVDNVEENRVQVFFPDKPSAEIRTELKSRGFRWAPSVGAWQRQRSAVALQYAKDIAAKAA